MKCSRKKMVVSMLAFGLTVLVVLELVTPVPQNWVFRGLVVSLGGMAGWLWQRYIFSKAMDKLKKVPSHEILLKGLSLLFGLLVVVLFSIILKPCLDLLTFREKIGLELALLLLTTWGSWFMVAAKSKELGSMFAGLTKSTSSKHPVRENQLKILDTSAIIDGRIADLSKTGFLEGVLVIPGFVLGELQKIADSADPLRRNRGRRGLDLLNRMQKESGVTLRIFDRDYDELTEVDTKLLKLAREMEAKVITNDFNLNKVAELYGVQVLNINDLSNAIKPVVLPGEEMSVHILRDGKEHGQGIGYLDDGTMIVVEGGKSYIGLDIEILVTSVLQTSAGRMIFAKPKDYLYSKVTS
ncbi:MAG TPA: PIN domain-containing protein [Bacillota bacterium]|nr:PIN domain-containing protein [Bacillota bacterium]